MKIFCVLYDDPAGGYPNSYPRDDLPKIDRYPDGQTLPSPSAIDFQPGQLLGSVSGELGLRKFLEAAGHELVVTSDKDGPDSAFERELVDADIVISQPFWPAYMTAERFAKAKNLKMVVTAGIGSDHTDLQAAIERGVTVAEVTYCNSISVSEHVVMMILSLVAKLSAVMGGGEGGGWDIADCAARSYDIEGMHVGTVAAGRIGTAVLRRLKPFDVHLHYTDRHRLPAEVEQELGLTFHESAADMVPHLRRGDDQLPAPPGDGESVRRGDDRADEARRLSGEHGAREDREPRRHRGRLRNGQLAGYAGDVWFPQPAPRDHPWRTMPHHGMTPHISGTSLSPRRPATPPAHARSSNASSKAGRSARNI